MILVPLGLSEANAFVARLHRHHKRVRGCKFAVGAEIDGRLVAVAIAGRPPGPGWNRFTLCVTRLCSDGTRNACSFLYSHCRRIGQAMGFRKIFTYLLGTEYGASCRAAGWVPVAFVKGRSWSRPKRPRVDKHPTTDKIRWEAPA